MLRDEGYAANDLRFMLHRLADVSEALEEVQQQYVGLRASRQVVSPQVLQLFAVSIGELEEEAIRLQAAITESETWDREPDFRH